MRKWTGLLSIALLFVAGAMGQGGPNSSAPTAKPSSGVTSFNGRTGAVVSASGDYSFSLITGTATPSQLPSTIAYTNQSNTFTASQSITGNLSVSGTLSANIPFSLITGTATESQLPTATAFTDKINSFTASQSITSGDLNLSSGNVNLPATTGPSSGVVMIGTTPFLFGYGSQNTFVGGAGNFTTSGSADIAIGSNALLSNTTGGHNTAVGLGALAANTQGNGNTAIGGGTLSANQTGVSNTAIGVDALNANTGDNNTASGFNALTHNTSGSGNTAIGIAALVYNTTGTNNIAIGQGAGSTNNSGSNGDANIYIGNIAETATLRLENESNTMRIGDNTHQFKTFLGGISNATIASGTAVVVDSNGQLGVATSSRRFKYDIEDMNNATDKLLRLRPVTFRYKQAQADGSHPLQYGLIAEEVAAVYPQLVQDSPDGKPYAVRYQVLPAMLLNVVQKQHLQIEAQQQEIQSLQSQLTELASQTRRLQAQMAAFQQQNDGNSKLAAVTTVH